MTDSRKIRLDRSPGRSGRPQPHPLAVMLTHAETAAFKRMAQRQGTSVNRILQRLCRAELKLYSEINSRMEIETAQFRDSHQIGYVPNIEPLIDKNRAKEKTAQDRYAKQSLGMIDKPLHFRG